MADIELEQKLENICSSVLEMLRGQWDIYHANHILLSLIFYKRILALILERKITFLSIKEDTLQKLAAQQHDTLPNPNEMLQTFEDILEQLSAQNKGLLVIFDILQRSLYKNVNEFWAVIQLLQDFDFSTRQFSQNTFGNFFSAALYQTSWRAEKQNNEANTPPFLHKLLILLCNPQRGEVIYTPSVGQAGFLVALSKTVNKLQLTGQETDTRTWALAQMNLWANGIYDSTILNQNSLLETPYELPPADIGIANCLLTAQVSTEQLSNVAYIVSPFDWNNLHQIDSNSLITQRLLYQLNENGRAVLVFPLQMSYKHRTDRKLREFLIRKNYVEAVIALPDSILPNSNSPVAILVINKKKTEDREQKILFINASTLETQQKSKLYKTISNENLHSIADILRTGEAEDSVFWKGHIAWISNEQVAKHQYNLNPKQYASPFIKKLQELSVTQQLKPIAELLATEKAFVWVFKEEMTNRNLKYVGTSDLPFIFSECELETEKLSDFQTVESNEGRLLSKSALLSNTDSKRLRLAYFEYKQEAIVVGKNVMILELNEQVPNVEYILLQLYSDLFAEQLQLYKSDHPDSSLSEREFAHLQIVMVSPEEQNRQVQTTKIALLKEEERKVENLRHRLNLGKQKAQSEQYKIISSLQHELGNRLPAILTEFKNLKDFIHDKTNSQETLSIDEPLFPLFEGEEAGNVETLGEILTRIENLLKHTVATIDNTGDIIKADKSRLNLQPMLIRVFLEQLAALYSQETLFSIEIEIEKDDAGKEIALVALIDSQQLSTAFINLIENAKRHGFIQDRKYTVRFQVSLSADSQEVIIEYENDGKPFPQSFSFDDFISYGNYAGNTGHSGIGGFLIYQIIDNHEGGLLLRDNIARNDPFKIQFEISLPVWDGI
jgi:type I restriction enzyme M protein